MSITNITYEDSNTYVIHVFANQEAKFIQECKARIQPDIIQDIYIYTKKIRKKYLGAWHIVEEPLFPGYVFIKTDDVDTLSNQLLHIHLFHNLLGNDHIEIYPLLKGELIQLNRFTDESHRIDISEGYIENGITYITDGPLVGYEGIIRKIDRHKRIAYVELEMFGDKKLVKVGLEIITKTTLI